ncbi:MAG: pyroglutamyl-peptidase I [Lachnospiraceae bacterium]|nr:pyroglutamyl-peptidase I [Lachnospiraceae bacterium]
MKRALITAFDPFGGESVNAAQEMLEKLPPLWAGMQLERRILPTAFRSSKELLTAWLKEDFDLVVLLGQAAGRSFVTPERIAVNLMDARIPDNEGYAPEELPVEEDGPAAYFADLPVKAVADRLFYRGLPVRLSDSAGTYVCNAAFYHALHTIRTLGLKAKADFVHVPLLPGQQEGKPVLEPELMLTSLLEILREFGEAIA